MVVNVIMFLMAVMFLMVCDKIMVKPVKGIQLRIITYALNRLFSN